MSETPPPAPPVDAPAAAPAYALFTPGQILGATLVGSPLAGVALLALNLRRTGRTALATKVLLAGIAGTAALVALAFVLPDAIGRALPIATVMAVWQYAR